MSFKRDFHVCECGHIRDEHSINYPHSKCFARECDCQQFSRLTKRRADSAKRGGKIKRHKATNYIGGSEL